MGYGKPLFGGVFHVCELGFSFYLTFPSSETAWDLHMTAGLHWTISRWQAAGIHFGISACVILGLAGLLSMTWYPPDYAWAVGGLSLIGILAGIDVCLGPLLTLIVWDIRKPGLRFDVAVIALCQVLALGYGLHAIFIARPVYMVFAKDRFELVSAVDIPEGELEKAKLEEFKSLPLTGPQIIGVIGPENPQDREKILFSSISGGADLPQLPEYYVPYSQVIPSVLQRLHPLDQLLVKNMEARNAVSVLLLKHGLSLAQVKYLPLRAKKHDQTVLVSASDGRVLGIINIDPW